LTRKPTLPLLEAEENLMARRVRFLILVLAFGAFLAPGLFMNAHAAFGCQTQPGNTCNLEAISHVPPSDGVVNVQICTVTESNDACGQGGQYSGACPASCFNLNYTWALDNGSYNKITVLNPTFIGATSHDRYAFKEWDYVGQYYDGSPTNPSMITNPIYTNYTQATCYQDVSGNWENCPFTAVFTVSPPLGCNTNCNLEALTNVPSADGTVKVQVDGGTVYSLGTTFSFANGTVHNIQVLNTTFTGSSSGAKYVWNEWNCTCGVSTMSQTLTTPPMYLNYTASQSGAFTALFDKQYPLTLTFTDQKGDALSPPSSLQLVSGNTVVNLTSFSGIYESALVWKVENVMWQGVPGIQVQGQTIDLTSGAVSIAIKLQAFAASIKAVDSSNNPVQGVTVTVYFQNSTSKAFQTNSQGLVELGYVPLNYTAVVTYNGNTICNCVVNTSNPQNNPYLVQVSVPGSSSGSAPLVSAVVILTIFGIAAFLVLLAIKVRKAPPPPRIE
jgi:hypothetical protein